MTKIGMTPAARRALRAVKAGEVTRVYATKGNSFRMPLGVGAIILYRLEKAGLIAEGRTISHGLNHICAIGLTMAGERELDSSLPR